MTATRIAINGIVFTLHRKEWRWKGGTKKQRDRLDYRTDEQPASGADPQPEFHLATRLAKLFNGIVVSARMVKYDPTKIY